MTKNILVILLYPLKKLFEGTVLVQSNRVVQNDRIFKNRFNELIVHLRSLIMLNNRWGKAK